MGLSFFHTPTLMPPSASPPSFHHTRSSECLMPPLIQSLTPPSFVLLLPHLTLSLFSRSFTLPPPLFILSHSSFTRSSFICLLLFSTLSICLLLHHSFILLSCLILRLHLPFHHISHILSQILNSMTFPDEKSVISMTCHKRKYPTYPFFLKEFVITSFSNCHFQPSPLNTFCIERCTILNRHVNQHTLPVVILTYSMRLTNFHDITWLYRQKWPNSMTFHNWKKL